MQIQSVSLADAKLITPRVFPDERGFFCETFRSEALEAAGVRDEWVQDNHSRSSRGVVRGLHFQTGEGAAKLVRCGRGRIWDVIVDLRRGSPTYRGWQGFELSDENMQAVYVPVGFAHGFCVLSDVADVHYKQSRYYDATVERGIAFDDPSIAVQWPLPRADILVSERDAHGPLLQEVADSLPFVY